MIDPPIRRIRHDGWTDERRSGFIAALDAGGSIAAAAASVGMSRRSAYRLRVRPDGAAVAAAWGVPTAASADEHREALADILDAAGSAVSARIDAALAADPAGHGKWLMEQMIEGRKRRFASSSVTFARRAAAAAALA